MCIGVHRARYLHLLQHRMVLDAREEHSHGVGPVVQERNSCPVQLLGQLVDISLQFSERCGQTHGQSCTSKVMLPVHKACTRWRDRTGNKANRNRPVCSYNVRRSQPSPSHGLKKTKYVLTRFSLPINSSRPLKVQPLVRGIQHFLQDAAADACLQGGQDLAGGVYNF